MSAPRRSARPTPRVDEATRGAVVEVGRSDAATSTTRPRRWRFDALPYVLVAPVAIFIVGLALVPAAFTIIESFFTVDALDPPTRFTGFGNFVALFHNDAVRNSVGNTAFYVLVGVALLSTGAMVGILSGGPPLKRALRQLAIGFGAAAITYVLGLVFGVGAV